MADPLDGHEKYRGRLVIPYVTPTGVVDIKYRCTEHENCKEAKCTKYLKEAGSENTLFNVRDLHRTEDKICLTEGEFDALAISAIAGIPAVGYPGTQSWGSSRHWRRCFTGFGTVFVIADGDAPGREAAEKILKDMRNAVLISMPDGLDANSFIVEHGAEAFIEKLEGLK